MSRLRMFAERSPLLFSVILLIVFVAIVGAIGIVGSMGGERAIEGAGVIGRAAMAACTIMLASSFGWRDRAGFRMPQHATPWIMILPPFFYLAIFYPLLFTGNLSLNFHDPMLAVLVGCNGLAAGVMEELVFRGLMLYALLQKWRGTRNGILKSMIISSLLFSLPHILNILAGHQPLRAVAQLVWAFLLGMVFAALATAGSSVWPVALLHGAVNAIVHVNRIGAVIKLSPEKAVIMALAPLPVLIYAYLILMKRMRRAGRD